MANTTTPNMSLILPGIGTEPGPTYGQDQNTSFTILDGHSHTPGSGVQITPAAININTNLTVNGNSIISLASTTFNTITANTTANNLYVALGSESVPIPDLWFNDGNGTAVQITSNGQVNATAASIPGESYGAGTFTWRQGTGSTVPANFDIGSITIRPNTAGTTNGITLIPYSGISSSVSIVLPALPSAQSFVTLDNSGNMVASILTAGGLTSSNIASATITGSNIAAATITGSNIAASTVTRQNQVAVNSAISSTSGTSSTTSTSLTFVPGLGLTIVTTGRPVQVSLQSDGSGNPSNLTAIDTANAGQISVAGYFTILRDSTVEVARVSLKQQLHTAFSTLIEIPSSAMSALDSPAAGSHTYTVQYYAQSASTVGINYAVLVAREL